ncbi:MAG TPA: histidine phosphatase family protein [Longimicrobium sp.]|nr:histidine phosphatase family protein [Longimicrobium sp.]
MIRRFRLPLLAAALLALPAAAAAQHDHAQAGPTTVIVVRHAEKVSTDPADRDPALDAAGQARAQALAAAVRGAGVDAVITTQFKRTRMTAQVLVDSLKLTPEVVAAGGPNHVQEVAAAVRKHAGHTVLVVGHSNTVPAIIAALGGPRLADLCDSQYADMFVLVLDGSPQPPLIRSTYGTPSPAPGPECNRAMRQ